MSDGSTLTQVKTALVSVLTARAGLSGVVVSQEPPLSGNDLMNSSTGQVEAIHLGEARTTALEVPFLSVPMVLDETYELDVHIQVARYNANADTQVNTDARAIALMAEVIGAVCADPDLTLGSQVSGATLQWITPAGWEHHVAQPQNEGHGALLTLRLSVHARLNLT